MSSTTLYLTSLRIRNSYLVYLPLININSYLVYLPLININCDINGCVVTIFQKFSSKSKLKCWKAHTIKLESTEKLNKLITNPIFQKDTFQEHWPLSCSLCSSGMDASWIQTLTYLPGQTLLLCHPRACGKRSSVKRKSHSIEFLSISKWKPVNYIIQWKHFWEKVIPNMLFLPKRCASTKFNEWTMYKRTSHISFKVRLDNNEPFISRNHIPRQNSPDKPVDG